MEFICFSQVKKLTHEIYISKKKVQPEEYLQSPIRKRLTEDAYTSVIQKLVSRFGICKSMSYLCDGKGRGT